MPELREYLRSLPVFDGELPVFDPDTAPGRPEDLFVAWLTSAVRAHVREPHAMTLSTLGTDGMPSARVLLLKNVDAGGWQFAAHSSSPKGRDLAEHPWAALTFYWPQQARQVRVRGRVAPAPAEHSAADFLARSVGARAEAMVGKQSQPIDDRQAVELTARQSLARITAEPDLVVKEWTLYTLTADQVEFWQADKDRKHTRLRYERDGGSWTRHHLWP